MQLAREYGVGAFCTYFYWFAGKILLETPLRQWLDDASLDLPICLCWANENWSRRWDGRGEDVLIAQQHSPEDDLAFIAYVAPYLRDTRYIRVDGKPLLLVYRPGLLPQPRETVGRWREWCREHGLGEIHLAYVQSFDRVDPRHFGFDAAVEFPPNNTTLEPITSSQRLINPNFAGVVHDWRQLAANAMRADTPDYLVYPGVNPGWDNEPRRSGGGRVLAHASPRGYRDWVRKAIDVARRRSPSAPLVFINAWNEWAEGAVLEPDTRLGYAWLEATRSALHSVPVKAENAVPCVVIHVQHVDALDQIVIRLRATGLDWRIVVTTSPELESAARERLLELGHPTVLEIHEQRGLDVLPFLHVADRLLDEGVEVVLKLHTMPPIPTHNGLGGQAKLLKLLDMLISPERATCILNAFENDLHLGLVPAETSALVPDNFLIADEACISALCVRLGLPVPKRETHGDFVVGNMFWVRLAALRPVLDAHLEPWEIDAEIRRIDYTPVHMLGCMAQLAVSAAGFHTRDAASVSASQPLGASVSTG
jgi:lipopolysaccharide biosynthesis protein